MRKFLIADWKNFLKISALPLLSLLAFLIALTSYANAGRVESAGGFVPDERRVLAPSELNELDYYRWTFQVSKIPDGKSVGADPQDGYDRLIAEKEEDAYAASNTKPEDMNDPEAKARFEEALKESFRADFNERAPGPYQKFVWAWYHNEKNYEAARAEELARLKTAEGRKRWVARYIANAQFEAANAAEVASVNTGRANCLRSWSAMIGTVSQTQTRCLPVFTAEENLQKKRQIAVTTLAARVLNDSALLSSAQAKAAEEALRVHLENLEASPFLRPEIYAKIKESPDSLYIDVDSAKWQNAQVETSRDFKIPARSTVGFDAYAIWDAPLESVLAVYQWRNGIPSGQQQLKKNPFRAYPADGLFNYRREESVDFSDLWGPGAFFNRSIKWNANRSVVRGLMDAYLVLVRGDATRGYDIVFQLLGKGCPPETELRGGRCSTQTTSNFTIATFRPLPDGKTVFKISGRFIGQSYGAPLPNGLDDIGFNVAKIREGQLEFAGQARSYASASARLKQAEAAGERVERVSSENGYYFFNNHIVRVANTREVNPRAHFLIEPDQNFFQINNSESVQLIRERGSQPYTVRVNGQAVPMPMQSVPLERLFSD